MSLVIIAIASLLAWPAFWVGATALEAADTAVCKSGPARRGEEERRRGRAAGAARDYEKSGEEIIHYAVESILTFE